MASKLSELQQKIDALQKERDDLLESEKSEAIENINAMVRTYGIRPRDIDFGDGSKPVSGTRAKAVAKYKSGSQTWSGRGRKPKWVENHVAKGGKLDDLLIK